MPGKIEMLYDWPFDFEYRGSLWYFTYDRESAAAQNEQEHQGVNNIFSHFLCFNFFRVIRIIQSHNNENSSYKKNSVPQPGIEPGTSDTGSKTKNAIFLKRGPLFRPEVIDRFCWLSIANIGRQQTFLYIILKKIEAKLRPREYRI